MQSSTQLSRWLLTAGGFLAFFAFGFIDNLKGPLLPEMLRGDALTDSQAGTVVFAAYLGFVVATIASGFLADLFSNGTVVWLAGVTLMAGAVGLGNFDSYASIIACMAIMGYGLGSIELGANGLMIELHSHASGRYLNLLSVFHGCGSLLVPQVAAWQIELGRSWQSIYVGSLLLALPLLILFWPTSARKAKESSTGQSPPSVDRQVDSATAKTSTTSTARRQLIAQAFRPIMLIYYVAIASYVAVELSVAAWMMELLQRERQMSVGQSSLYLTGFFVLLMLGRLLGALVVERLDYLTAVAGSLVGSILCLCVGLWAGDSWIFFLSISGFCMSIAFPTMTAAVTRLNPIGTGTILGILFAAGGMGGALGPWIVGLVSTQLGLRIGLSSTILFALVSLTGVCLLWRIERVSAREA